VNSSSSTHCVVSALRSRSRWKLLVFPVVDYRLVDVFRMIHSSRSDTRSSLWRITEPRSSAYLHSHAVLVLCVWRLGSSVSRAEVRRSDGQAEVYNLTQLKQIEKYFKNQIVSFGGSSKTTSDMSCSLRSEGMARFRLAQE
jgi:hypothetical protein